MTRNGRTGGGAEKGPHRRFLATKLRPPSAGVRHMPRPRLSGSLASLDSFRLALVSAPAGTGKTTLLSEWFMALQECQAATAWLSLDDFDNEPRRFLANLIASIRSVRPEIGREAIEYLAANPDVLVEDVAETLVHDFGNTKARIVVFLDDYHEIRDRTIHAVLEFLLRYVPPNVQWVLGTRRDPPLSLGRFRGRGELLEIRWEELRFNAEESREYLMGVCRLRLSEEQVRVLGERTEGWITGLQLAAVTWTGGEDAGRFVAGISGAHRKVADYLLEGVFRGQTSAVRNFLMETAVLDRLSAPLCDAITGKRGSQQLMETLETANLFIFGLDDRRTWYRYHRLFAEFLRHRLRVERPEKVGRLYDKASDWFEKNGFPADAMRHAIAGHRFVRAGRLLETAGRELFYQGDFKELRRCIDALPESTVLGSPVLCVLHAWALGYLGEFEGAVDRIVCAEKAMAKRPKRPGVGGCPDPVPIRAELQVLRAVLGIIRADRPDVSGMPPDIPSRFPPEESVLRGYAFITLGFARRVEGNLPLGLRHFQEALAVLESSGGANSSLVNLNARLNIGTVKFMMGRIREAEESFRGSLDVARDRLWLRSIGAAFLRYGLALVLLEKNRSGEALKELSEAIAFLEASDAFGFLGVALVERARVHLALGRDDLAAADLAQAREVARRHGIERVSFRADLLETRMAVRSSDFVKASKFLESAGKASGAENGKRRRILPETHECFLMEQIRYLLAMGKHGEALQAAGRAIRSAESSERGRNRIEFLVLRTAALAGLSRPEEGTVPLERAVRLAAEEGIVRPFMDCGEEIVPLLRRLAAREGAGSPAAEILSALGASDVSAGSNVAGPNGEPFHHREVQILELVSQGLRNREIGKRLFLSGETVKWYLKRLYCKLYVRTRTEAIAKARELGLLD